MMLPTDELDALRAELERQGLKLLNHRCYGTLKDVVRSNSYDLRIRWYRERDNSFGTHRAMIALAPTDVDLFHGHYDMNARESLERYHA